jgi:proteasome lid subunit RPN8/RPN11
MTLKIKKTHLNEILEEARKNYPIEACGILIGRINENERIVEEVYHARNVLSSTSAYQIDPIDELKAFEEAEKEGLEVIGFYHSHPFWDPFWSNIDEEKGKLWVGYLQLIVSPKKGKVKAYLKKENGVEEEEINLI